MTIATKPSRRTQGFCCWLILLALTAGSCSGAKTDDAASDASGTVGTVSTAGAKEWSPLEKSLIRAMEAFSTSLDDYWSSRFPSVSSGSYRSPKMIVPYRRGTVPDLGCGIRHDPPEKWAKNAVYCREDEKIAYEVELIVEEGKQFGALPSLLVLAHEWGHHIQFLAGDLRAYSLPIELGADCYLGMFAAEIDRRHLFGNELGSASGSLQTAVAATFLSGHTYQRWFDRGVHGTPRERAIAFKVGVLTEDPEYCRSYAQYRPQSPYSIGSYEVGVPPGFHVFAEKDQLSLRFGSVLGTVVSLPSLASNASAEAQIDGVLDDWFAGTDWHRDGPITDVAADPTFGGSKAVQPYKLQNGIVPSYGAVMLHVGQTGSGILIDIHTAGAIESAGPDAYQPIGDFMYVLLANTCPPDANDVVCTQPLGARPAS